MAFFGNFRLLKKRGRFKMVVKKVIFLFLVFVGFSNSIFSQGGATYGGKEIIDTMDTGRNKILLFADKT